MKKIHYRNIGFPKTGTNWLWLQFMRHPLVDAKLQLVYKEYNAPDLSSYKKVYEEFDVSVNLDTHAFHNILGDDYFASPKNIHEHTTHMTMFLRSPYDVLNSMYNMDKNRNSNFKGTQEEYTNINSNIVKLYSDFDKIFDYWSNCKVPILYLFYDDLVSDPKQFMYTVCEHIGIKPFYDPKRGPAFQTDKKDPLVFDNQETIDYINKGISVIENRFSRDLSHWKR